MFDLLTELHGHFNIFGRVQAMMTGSGSVALSPILNASYAQEVSAVAAAVENEVPQARTAIDLGGQDAILIVWQTDPGTAHRRRFTNMNKKCAGGSGATLDRIVHKLGLDQRALKRICYSPEQVHPVSSKCGIFAETDINSLIKKGIPADACLVSICDAIVRQNLSTLTRGKPIQPPVVLLGGPHAHCPCLCQAWAYQLNRRWKQEGISSHQAEPRVIVPDDAVFLAARGAILAGRSRLDNSTPSLLAELDDRDHFIRRCATAAGQKVLPGPKQHRCFSIKSDSPCLLKTPYPVIHTRPAHPLEICIGLDAGSTSTKAIAIDKDGTAVARAYRLAQGEPMDSAKSVLHDIGRQVGHDRSKVAARIPHLAVADFLSFRCGPDAAALHVVEQICRCSKTPYFAFHDMDQNKPDGSLKIRIETIDHYLKNYGRRLASGPSPVECQIAADTATTMIEPTLHLW
ncbi:uncharacterized protein Dvar_17670 [Desulfosarcina variabilis str. Montpellier]